MLARIQSNMARDTETLGSRSQIKLPHDLIRLHAEEYNRGEPGL